MKKTLLLTSVLLGLHSAAANAKNEIFMGAAVNVSNDKYQIDKNHSSPARMGINSNAINQINQGTNRIQQEINKQTQLIAQYDNNIGEVLFAVANQNDLTVLYNDAVAISNLSTLSHDAFTEIVSNPNTTFAEKQLAVHALIAASEVNIQNLSNSTLYPFADVLTDLFYWNGMNTYSQQILAEIQTTTTVAELNNVFQQFSSNVNTLLTNEFATFPVDSIKDMFANAGLEALSLEAYQNILNDPDGITLAYQNLISNAQAIIADLEEANAFLAEALEAVLENRQNVLAELDSIESKASEVNKTVSLFAGFRADVAKHFMLGFELGTDLGNIKIGDNARNELEIRGGTGFYALARLGVNLTPNFTVYGQSGLMTRKYEMSYEGDFVSQKSGSKNIVSAIYGFGLEGRVSKNLALFAEYNYITSIDNLESELIRTSLKSEQLKIGSRYYFGL